MHGETELESSEQELELGMAAQQLLVCDMCLRMGLPLQPGLGSARLRPSCAVRFFPVPQYLLERASDGCWGCSSGVL